MNDQATLPFSLALPESAPLPLDVVELSFHEAFDEPFRLELVLHSTEHAIDPADVVGRTLRLQLPSASRSLDLTAIVALLRQESTVPTGVSRYRMVAMAPLWLASHRVDHRIFQEQSVPEIVASVLAGYGGRIPAPVLRLERTYPALQYVAQYGETDLDFLRRILAEAGIALCHFHDGSGAPVLVDDNGLLPKEALPLPFRDPSRLVPDSPHVREAAFEASVAASRVNLRDYDYERPAVALDARAGTADVFASEQPLERYEFEVGLFGDDTSGSALALTRLEEQRCPAERALFRTNVTLGAGSVMELVEHPRSSANREWLVVRSRARAHAERHLFEIEAIPLDLPYRPLRLPKPRILGTQTAVVVGAPGEEIDVDALGRVCLRFRWDRRDKPHDTTRRARVSQGWAGPGYGFSCLPRVGDEVVVDFLDGDPDQPLIVGRVHNGQSPTPRALPAEKMISTWRSRSTPGGAGFNEIALDDSAGAERIFVHAERDLVVEVGHDALMRVQGDVKNLVHGSTSGGVIGSSELRIEGDAQVSVGGDLTIDAANITARATDIALQAGDERIDESSNHRIRTGGFYVRAGSVVQLVTPHFHVYAGDILLTSGGASISIRGGNVSIRADGVVDVNGAVIKLNS